METCRDEITRWGQFALLLIDVQRDFWPEKLAKCFPDFPANVTKLLALCWDEGYNLSGQSDSMNSFCRAI